MPDAYLANYNIRQCVNKLKRAGYAFCRFIIFDIRIQAGVGICEYNANIFRLDIFP